LAVSLNGLIPAQTNHLLIILSSHQRFTLNLDHFKNRKLPHGFPNNFPV
jgi:hypothetical protein